MGHVDEQRLLRPDLIGGGDRLIHAEVRGMRAVAKHVEHEHAETGEPGPRLRRNRRHVRAVRERKGAGLLGRDLTRFVEGFDAEPEHGQPAMQQPER